MRLPVNISKRKRKQAIVVGNASEQEAETRNSDEFHPLLKFTQKLKAQNLITHIYTGKSKMKLTVAGRAYLLRKR